MPSAGAEPRPGSVLELDVGPVAHGGHCVARHEGRVVFVRHTLPGERVRAVVTEGATGSRFLRADAVAVVVASPERVEPPCPYAGPGRCGGCDWQHASLTEQRRLKAEVVTEQLRRLAGIERSVVVEEVPGSPDGLGWRTRVRFAVDAEGRAGLRRHRSHQVVPVDRCRIAHPGIDAAGVTARSWPGRDAVQVVAPAEGEALVLPSPVQAGESTHPISAGGPPVVIEHAAGRSWRVSGAGFWQVHPGAADALSAAVCELLQPGVGERALDLYCGAGLLAGVVAQRVGPGGRVSAVESDRLAVADARHNLRGCPGVRVERERVERWLARPVAPRVDLVVLDPPRSGAGRVVVERIVARRPRAIAYVACDPAALARDVATFARGGYRLGPVRAYDLFPMTAHVECVALLHRRGRSGGRVQVG